MSTVSSILDQVTGRVRARSASERTAYLEQIRAAQSRQPYRNHHVCSNLAHGLHIPGSAFINPGTPLREALTRAAARRITQITALGTSPIAIGAMLDERSFVNAIVGVLATGGSTNHTMHLVAMAKAAGIQLTWDDFADLSAVVPLLARVYPNGNADVNHFHAAGGLGFVIRELLDAGLLHEDVCTVMGSGLRAYTQEPWLDNGALAWRAAPSTSLDDNIVRPASQPFSPDGGLKLVQGNLGRAVLKTSGVPDDRYIIEAPAAVFDSQIAVEQAFHDRCDRLKFFPAAVAGGLAALQAFYGPFPQVKFCPTGGINAQSAATYLKLPNVACVGGSWLAPQALMEAGDWQAIAALANNAVSSLVGM